MQSDLFPAQLTVSQLTGLIKKTLEEGFYGLAVTGEISNFRPSSTGHWFFALKDEESMIGAVMFKSALWRVPFKPQDGDKVVVKGHLSVWDKRGTYQIVCDSMVKAGAGNLAQILEERKQRYNALGYFAPELKKPIPLYPKRVGVVTSPTGAALHDVLRILHRRAPSLDVLILPCTVQGDGAAATIAQRIEEANLLKLCDVLIVGRGGGSLEDLMPFSEEPVIEAIHESKIPVVSGIGHEIDWAISDFVADLRASTPSAAAELVSSGYAHLISEIEQYPAALFSLVIQKIHSAGHELSMVRPDLLLNLLRRKVSDQETQLAYAKDALREEVVTRLNDTSHQLALLRSQLENQSPREKVTRALTELRQRRSMLDLAVQGPLERASRQVDIVHGRLEALSPLSILQRGYSVVTASDGTIIRSSKDARKGEQVHVRLAHGSLGATITQTEEGA